MEEIKNDDSFDTLHNLMIKNGSSGLMSFTQHKLNQRSFFMDLLKSSDVIETIKDSQFYFIDNEYLEFSHFLFNDRGTVNLTLNKGIKFIACNLPKGRADDVKKMKSIIKDEYLKLCDTFKIDNSKLELSQDEIGSSIINSIKPISLLWLDMECTLAPSNSKKYIKKNHIDVIKDCIVNSRFNKVAYVMIVFSTRRFSKNKSIQEFDKLVNFANYHNYNIDTINMPNKCYNKTMLAWSFRIVKYF